MADFRDEKRSNDDRTDDDELTRAVREGVRPEGVKEKLEFAADKLTGNVPMGIDAPNKTVRKTIGGASELLHLLKYGFTGLILFLAGVAFLYVGVTGEINLTMFALGAALLLLGLWGLRSAYRAGRNLRSISKA
jgi:hypothetical protein